MNLNRLDVSRGLRSRLVEGLPEVFVVYDKDKKNRFGHGSLRVATFWQKKNADEFVKQSKDRNLEVEKETATRSEMAMCRDQRDAANESRFSVRLNPRDAAYEVIDKKIGEDVHGKSGVELLEELASEGKGEKKSYLVNVQKYFRGLGDQGRIVQAGSEKEAIEIGAKLLKMKPSKLEAKLVESEGLSESLGTALRFNEEGRAAVVADALRKAGFGVLWDPKRANVVMTSAAKEKAKEIAKSVSGVDGEWFKRKGIDCSAKAAGKNEFIRDMRGELLGEVKRPVTGYSVAEDAKKWAEGELRKELGESLEGKDGLQFEIDRLSALVPKYETWLNSHAKSGYRWKAQHVVETKTIVVKGPCAKLEFFSKAPDYGQSAYAKLTIYSPANHDSIIVSQRDGSNVESRVGGGLKKSDLDNPEKTFGSSFLVRSGKKEDVGDMDSAEVQRIADSIADKVGKKYPKFGITGIAVRDGDAIWIKVSVDSRDSGLFSIKQFAAELKKESGIRFWISDFDSTARMKIKDKKKDKKKVYFFTFESTGPIVRQEDVELSEALLGINEKYVIAAFAQYRRAGDSKKISTDGKRLDGNWMGGTNIAYWGDDDKIHMNELGSKSAQEVQRYLRSVAPRRDLANNMKEDVEFDHVKSMHEEILGEYRTQSYSRDPYLMKARSDGKDSKGREYKRGEEIMFYPIGKKTLSGSEKDKAWAEFQAAKDDERFMSGESREDVMGEGKAVPGLRFVSKQYGLTSDEATRLLLHPKYEKIISAIEKFKQNNGWPVDSSPLVRGLLLDLLSGKEKLEDVRFDYIMSMHDELLGEGKELRPNENIKPGTKVKLVKPISDMEKDLLKKKHTEFEFVRWAKPHGYAVCGDELGNWNLHPEALEINESEDDMDRAEVQRIADSIAEKMGKKYPKFDIVGLAVGGSIGGDEIWIKVYTTEKDSKGFSVLRMEDDLKKVSGIRFRLMSDNFSSAGHMKKGKDLKSYLHVFNSTGPIVRQEDVELDKRERDIDELADEVCNTPGMRKRSYGRGRGLATGKGKGPLGVPVGKSISDIAEKDSFVWKELSKGGWGGMPEFKTYVSFYGDKKIRIDPAYDRHGGGEKFKGWTARFDNEAVTNYHIDSVDDAKRWAEIEARKWYSKKSPAIKRRRNESISDMRDELLGESGESEVNGKKGVWRRVANHNIFFPDDKGADPIGIPKPKSNKQKEKEMKKAAKKVTFFNKLFKGLKSRRNGK